MMGERIDRSFLLNRFCYILILLSFLVSFSYASSGDRSNEFRGCLYVCRFNNCSEEFSQDPYYSTVHEQLSFSKLVHRSCSDECKYHCMWQVTNMFLSENRGIPQFFGKWPFIRIFGLDEPASVLFSLLNLLGHCYGLYRLRTQLPADAPMFGTWQLYGLVCINTWLWSAIFHARDLPITERLDYFSAFAMVLINLYTLCLRVVGPGKEHIKQSVGAAAVAFYGYHIWYLMRRFDYGYNMKVNVGVGIFQGIGWLCWCYMRRSRDYIHLCVWVMVICAFAMVLELMDFPPIGWVLDAHAIWHLITAPLVIVWYRFVVADCNYMVAKQREYILNIHQKLAGL